VRLDAGEMWTMLGAEVVAAPDNFNITRGLVWGTQPVTNTGVLVSTDVGPITMAVGWVNDVTGAGARDNDTDKAVTAKLGFSTDIFSATGSVIYGSSNDGCVTVAAPTFTGACTASSNKQDHGIFDFLVTLDPTDSVSAYLDYTMNWYNNSPTVGTMDEIYVHGLSLATRVGVTDSLGLAARGEIVITDDGYRDDLDIVYSVTGTVDYSLTDNLLARAEVRYDWGSPGMYVKSGDSTVSYGTGNNRFLVVAEMVYTF